MSKPVMSLIPPVKDATEPYVGGYGHLGARYLVVIPEAPLTANGLMPTTAKQMGFFRHMVQSFWKEVYITPLVKYRRSSKAKTLYAKDIRHWLPILFQEIKLHQPQRIMVMGKFVAKYLIPNFTSMRNDHGALFTVNGEELDPTLSGQSYVIMPTFSFQDVIRDPMAQNYFQRDFERFSMVNVTKAHYEIRESLSEIPIPENSRVVVDVETDGLNIDSHIHMIGVGYDTAGVEDIFIVHHPDPDDLAQFVQNVNDANANFGFHNTTFDLAQITTSSNYQMPKLKRRVEDSMVAAHISGIHVKNLKHLTTTFTNLPGPHSGGGIHDEQYLAEDVLSTMRLIDTPKVNLAKGTYADHLYHDLAPIFVDMRLRGVYLNRDRILETLIEAEQKLVAAQDKLNSFTNGQDINWNSTQQVVDLMLSKGVPLTATTKTGNLSVAEGVLEELMIELKDDGSYYAEQLEMIKALLGYRAIDKLVSGFLRSYLDLIDDQWLIYPNLKLLGTATGRLSCSDPNLQQIPRVGDFKLCFEPRWTNPMYSSGHTGPGYYGLVDFAGAELRMAAIVSGDKQMAEFILSGDPHSHMARIAFPNHIPSDATNKQIKEEFAYWRKRSKSTTFAMLYGGSVRGIAFKNGVPESEVGAVEIALRKAAPQLMGWLDKTKIQSVNSLRISTMFGNQRNLLDKMLYEGKGGVERAGINTPIQGSAGILALIVLRKLHSLSVDRGFKSRPIFGVHDSIISEIAEDEVESYGRLVQEAYRDIENSPIVDYPVYHMLGVEGDLEIGRNWANTESTNEHVDIIQSIPCDSRG